MVFIGIKIEELLMIRTTDGYFLDKKISKS